MCACVDVYALVLLLLTVGDNSEHLDKIEKSLFLLCLDKSTTETHDPSADEFSRAARRMLYGDGSSAHSTNRWFDKTLQVSTSSAFTCVYVCIHVPIA